MAINIADYKRNGIFIKEIDNSISQVPIQTEKLSLVIGFSRKGVVNKPVLISTPQELYNIFGDIDRLMEKKGCYFHRTILSILNQAPVWCLNLLDTDSELDLLEWKSLSLSSNTENAIVKKSPYEDFFDKSNFWERDDEAFLTVADENRENDNHILHITNMNDKPSTVFIYKSSSIGYDDTLDAYYGSIDKVPSYLNPNDQAKDYIVSVLIVQGNWSDYATLSVDTRWSQYFNSKGLRKDKINNFRTDQAVTVLKYYPTLSIIPYFKNLNREDIFIETLINNDTDTHGIFVAFDIDKVEDSDSRNGMLDLIGSNLVDSQNTTINYLSYNETITENIIFDNVVLNRQGNAFGKNLEYETLYYGTPLFSQTVGTGLTEVTLTGIDYYNLSGVKVIPTASNSTEIYNTNIGKIRKDTIYLDDSGNIGNVSGIEVSNQTLWENVPLASLPTETLPIGIVYVGEQASSTSGVGLGIESISTINNLVWGLGSTSGNDINITYNGVNEIVIEFVGTKTSDLDTNYKKTLLNALFADLQSNFYNGVSIIKDVNNNKIGINNSVLSTNTSANKSLTITVSPSININRGDDLQIYFIDDEQTLYPTVGSESFGMKTISNSTSGYGIVSVNSKIYKAYKDGIINSGDYFYPRLFDIDFGKVEFYTSGGNSFIKFWYDSGDIDNSKLSIGRKIKITNTLGNNSIYTILTNTGEITGQPGEYNAYTIVIVNESVLTETANDVVVSGASDSDKRYMKMYLESGNLTVMFTQDEDLIGSNSIDFVTTYNLENINVYSNRSDFKQSLEIEAVIEQNEILVSAERYGEVAIGNYLQAYVNVDELEAGEVPKRLTRIIGKQLYSADPSLVVLKTDAAIDIITFGEDKQTFRYTTIEDYVNTYSAISLSGFKIRTDSIPDGTEERQSSILDMIAVGTPIFKGLVNRNKISFRYLVDCWGNGLTANSKQQFVDLCGERLTCLGLLNMPSAKAFKKSTSPSFIDENDKTLRMDYVRLGANPNSNPAFRYTFGTGAGQSNVAYFFPYVTITDNGRPTLVPPAMFVANTFWRKHNSNLASVRPWTVAAGLSNGNGIVTGFGNTEHDFTNSDLEDLNQMGANPIVYNMNRAFCIENDNTAQQSPKSSLSNTHAREVLIELEEEMYNMLINYQWRENTPEVRDEIKGKADKICQRFVKEKGLYNFINIMDETNNTQDIIDAQIGIIQTKVEIIKAMGILVSEITIVRPGTISSTGFTL